MPLYIQRRDGRELETVDSAESRREAGRLVREYRFADASALYYVSTRATADWRNAEREAARPAEVMPAGFLPAFHDGFGGLRPCQILAARSDSSGAVSFKVRFTGRGRGEGDSYGRGTVHTFPARFIVPRGAIRRASGCVYVRRYDWQADGFPELANLRHTGPGAGRWQAGANMAPPYGAPWAADRPREVSAEELAPVSPSAAHARALARAFAREAAERGAVA